MCTNPIYIKNPSQYYRPSDKTTLAVPCGECEECRMIRKNEYRMRTYYEMLECSQKGNNIYFFTLTYDDAHLPKSTIYPNGVALTIPCFRRSDIIKFFNSLRKYLHRKYGIKGISYICCSEYGDDTTRSHHHVMFSCENKFDMYEFHRLVQKFWQNGFIYPRYADGVDPTTGSNIDSHGFKHNPIQVSKEGVLSASKYISKYCCKDMSFYGLSEVDKYCSFLKAYLKQDIDEETYKYIKHDLLYECMPFTHTSRHFGECINEKVKSLKDLLVGIEVPFKDKLQQIPSYNKRKLLYHVRTVKEDPTIKVIGYDRFGNIQETYKVKYDLTSLGRKYFTDTYNIVVNFKEQQINHFLTTTIESEEFRSWFKSFGEGLNLSLFSKYSRAMAIYATVYQDRCSPLHLQSLVDCGKTYINKFRVLSDLLSNAGVTYSIYSDVPKFKGNENLDQMEKKAFEFFLCSINHDRYLGEGELLIGNYANITSVHFNAFPCYERFDQVLSIMKLFHSYERNIKYISQSITENDINKLKKQKEVFN